jgi:hypothetical protein
MDNNEHLNKLVNASGFVFQVGLEYAIRAKQSQHRWSIIAREHPWALSQSGAEGFIDLILGCGHMTGVVECKRTRGGMWVFLVPDGEEAKQTATRSLWMAGTEGGRSMPGWDPIQCVPPSYVSSFCTVRGSGENDRPLLERLCATLLHSVEALADEECPMLERQNGAWQRVYLPMIVTTAELRVCRFAPYEVDISQGTIDHSDFEPVSFIRFQKAFSTSGQSASQAADLGTAAAEHERTVLVVQADKFIGFLSQLDEAPAFLAHSPWRKALEKMRATTA